MGDEKFWLMLERLDGVYPNFNGTYYQSGNDRTIDKPLKEEYVFEHIARFHSSWDWLMPVAEKCLTSDEKTDGQHYFINDALLTCNIDVVYDRVVEFIKDYNQNN